MKSLKALVFLATVLLAGQAHAAESGLAAIQKAGKVIIAVDPTYPPMESEDPSGKLVGYDIDFGNELAKRLGVKAEFLIMGYEGIIGGLRSGRYDLIVSTMNITPERSQQIDFVEYAKMSQMFVTRRGEEVKSEKDLAGRIVTVPTDTTSYDFVQKVKATVAIKEIKAYRLTADVFMAVKAGHADTIVVDEPVARYFVKQDPQTFTLSGRAMAPEPVGIGIQKTAVGLKDAVAKAVDGMQKDGFVKSQDQKWFGSDLGSAH